MSGEQFARSLMAPVPLDSLMFVVQGGMPADFTLGLTLNAFELYRNAYMFGAELRPADPQFWRQIELLNALQRAAAISVEATRHSTQSEFWLSFNPPESLTTEAAEQIAEFRELLGIPGELDRVRVIFGSGAEDPGVIGMRTRSFLHILRAMGLGVQIPQENLVDGSASPGDVRMAPSGFTVRVGGEEPDEALAAAQSEGHRLWIDCRHRASKTLFSIVTMMFSFLEASSGKSSPELTIPAN